MKKDRSKNKETMTTFIPQSIQFQNGGHVEHIKGKKLHKIWKAQLAVVRLAVLRIYLLAHSTDNFEM